MSKYQTPYRYDFVGSFLRPQEVKQAKADYSEGKITKEECDAIVDKAVTEVVAKQKELGFHIITDGEFRRTYWHLDFMWGFEGVGHEQTGAGVQFNAEMAAVEDTYLIGKVKAKAHPFVEGFKFLKQFEDENTVAKYTIPAPAQMFQQMIVPANFENTRKYYATNEELIRDIGKAYQEVIKQFYEAGCRNLQLDDCTWGAIVGDAAKQRYKNLGQDLDEVKGQLLEVNNLALEGKPAAAARALPATPTPSCWATSPGCWMPTTWHGRSARWAVWIWAAAAPLPSMWQTAASRCWIWVCLCCPCTLPSRSSIRPTCTWPTAPSACSASLRTKNKKYVCHGHRL